METFIVQKCPMKKHGGLFLLLALLVFSPSLFAQVETSEVLGTVHDPSNAAVAGATVTLTNKGAGISSQATTDENGNYDFLSVKVGDYGVAVEMTGFSKFTTDVRVDVDVRQRVDAALRVGVVTQSVEVTGAAATLDTDSSEHAQVVATQAAMELPLNGRNYADLALLSTGTVKSPIAVSFGPTGTPREGSFNVNGMRSTYNNFILDGLDNNAYGTSNQGYSSQTVQLNPDAVSEFKVITSNYSAEYGRVGGAVVNAVMKGGTNSYHGTAYEFVRNTDLNTYGYQFSAPLKPTLQRNQFGFTIGGPFIKNRLFFFADYEGYRQLQKYNNFDSIPNMNDRGGILPVPVYDNLNHTLYPANTQIPIASLNQFASTVLGQLPTVAAGATRSNDLFESLLIKDYADKYDVKIDGQINANMNAFVRFSQRKDLDYYAPDIPGPSGGNGNGHIHTLDQNASIGYTWTVTPTSLFEARFGVSRIDAGKQPPLLGGASMLSLYGIPGLPTTPNLTGGLNSQNISGFSQLGRQTSNPQFQNPLSFNPKFNYSIVRGNHSLKMGYETLIVRTEILDINPLYGEDQFTGNFSKPTCAELGVAAGCTVASDSASYNLADFIFGTPSIINLGNDLVVNLRQHVHSLYFQDDYRLTPKLTLNLGLRWDFATPLYERDNNYTNFDPVTVSMVKATSGSLFDRSLVHPDYKDWGPRLGAAYSIDTKTVARAGYGISYTFFNRVGSALEGINAPQALFGVINQSIPAGGPVPAGFLTTQNSFTTGIDNPSSFNPVNSNVVYVPPDTRWPYIQNWFVSVQRELPMQTVLEVAYNGNHSLRLPILGDYNQALPNAPGGTLGVQARRPIPSFGPITWVDPVGNNNYNGLSVRLEHKFTSGLHLLNSFTWGRGLGDSEQALEYFSGYVEANPQNIHDLAAEYGPSSFDVRLNDVTSVIYQLPFGKGRRYGSDMNAIEDAVAGGWEINTINTAHTGNPINVYYGPTTSQDVTGLSNDYRGEAFLRPNVTGSGVPLGGTGMINKYFNGYTFTTPPVNAPFGDLGRNAFRAPGFEQWDFALDKYFTIHEDIRLQFRSEFFNFLNHTNFGIPNTQTTNSAFGTIRSTYPARQIQFALKLDF
jgi:carboxypeptidase family protein/TonB-dependent receptor-like protein